MTISQLQLAVGEWHRRHFPDADTTRIVLKTAEEVGELCKARERMLAGYSIARDEERDAIGDVLVCLLALCDREGYDLGAIARATLDEIGSRDHARVIGT